MSTARLVLKALRTRFVDQRPFILSHLLTARCNADCATCLWKRPADSRADELSTEEIGALYKDAAAAGFLALVLWGGEPMLRPDVGAALHAAREAGLDTTLITNGWWLDERGDEVLPWTQRLLVSVDGIGAAHDEIRRCPGLFARLERGLERTRKQYPGVQVTLVSVISRLNRTALQDIAAFGRTQGAQVIFQAMNLSDYGFADRTLDLARIRLTPAEETEVALIIGDLRRAGYPVRDSNSYLSQLGKNACDYRCHYKKVLLRVEPNGEVLDCTKEATPLTSLRHEPLAAFIASAGYRDFLKRAEACNRCRDAGVIEASHIWEGKVGALRNAFKSLA